MPRRRSRQERDEVAEFVNRLVDASGAKTTVEFAAMAGLYDSNVSEYRSGSSVPDGYNLLRMIRAAAPALGALGEAAGAPSLVAPRVRPAALPAAVGDLLDWQGDVAAKLRELETRLEQIETGQASQKESRPAGGHPL